MGDLIQALLIWSVSNLRLGEDEHFIGSELIPRPVVTSGRSTAGKVSEPTGRGKTILTFKDFSIPRNLSVPHSSFLFSKNLFDSFLEISTRCFLF